MPTLQELLEQSASHHSHLCPRQILGVRIGLAGAAALGLEPNSGGKQLLAILETDGCFADGVATATGCTVGHRTLRVEDYGKIAATFADVRTGRAVRLAPVVDLRLRALDWAQGETRPYIAQMRAYQVMPDRALLTVTEVQLVPPVEQIVSRHGLRVDCAVCGEEIINERHVLVNGRFLCQACSGQSYYLVTEEEPAVAAFSEHEGVEA